MENEGTEVMKKMTFVLTALLLSFPAMANLNISCKEYSYGSGFHIVEIDYIVTEDSNLPRGFGLEVTVDSGATITSVDSTNPDYWVYPGSIVIDTNDPPSVADYGTPIANGLGTGNVILEMGSLHYPTGPDSPNAPNFSDMLIRLQLSGGDCNVTVSGNAERGNVVNYDAKEAETVYGAPCFIEQDECLVDDGGIEYDNWVFLGRPDCWCYPRQCRGDADGSPIAPGLALWVKLSDLIILRGAINKFVTDPTWPDGGECADLNHTMVAPTVPIPVSLADLNIIRMYLSKMDIPWNTVVKCCDSNEDCVPDGVIYNFWTGPTTP
ncbi:MAG: hypothetical protein JW804_03755 [Sedimentisphaerales bacterium]|nr:hypothetical protein [Sedimentisphaerales bacterium]